MDINARWEKILHDIWSNKQRSLLVIFTIAIGIAAIGMINNTVRMLKRDLFGQFSERNPASILVYAAPFPESLADGVSGMREVELAEVQRSTEAYAAGATYFPEALGERRYYQPVNRGLEIKIGEKLAYLRSLDRRAAGEGRE